ncbi:UDP-N-acetylmuramoyl-L-alanyl-D-glutamate--2,6-diaminopimelate ligase [Caldicellulosiruptoraceae bacterium PP1]
MKFSDLIKVVDISELKLNEDFVVNNVSCNSKEVNANDVFVCIKGFKTDGHLFINDAINNGAKAVIVDNFYDTHMLPENINYVKTSNTRKALAKLSAHLYNYPSKEMIVIGVTGTNGKTSTTYMIKSILEHKGIKTGLIGTIKNMIGYKVIPTERTTPESNDLQKLFYQMKQEDVKAVVMEVSSHSLELSRVDETDFDVGVFTNLTQDHLDFHQNMDNYFNAKLKLFKKSKKSVINIDDEWGKKIIENKNIGDILCYSINDSSDVIAKNIKIFVDKSTFDIEYNGEVINIILNIPGYFSIYNALAAATTAIHLGIDLETIKNGLNKIKGISGRFEIVESNPKFTIVVDYAHTPDGIENLMRTVKTVAKGRKVLLFGCGGDRDRTKRPIMGEIAGNMADYVIVTSDNPRCEDPQKIIDDIIEGIRKTNVDYIVIPDRYEAIKYAIMNAKPNDFIVLAGKGHEDYQIIMNEKIHFDEREVVAKILEEIKNETNII